MIGIPAGLQGMMFSIANVCIQSAINSFGSNAIAGSAAALNYEFFSYFMVNAFAQAAVTFTSQMQKDLSVIHALFHSFLWNIILHFCAGKRLLFTFVYNR